MPSFAAPVAERRDASAGAMADAAHPTLFKPLVSIVINNCNYERYLREAVDSALAQTYAPIEIVVVDDGSTDNSRAILACYQTRIRLVLKQNGGQASALNAGFAQCRGSIVLFLDSDDVLLPQAIEAVVNAFGADRGLAKVHFKMEVVNAAGERSGDTRPPPYVPMLDGDLRRHYLTFPDDVWRLPTSANAFPAAVLRQIMPMDEDGYRTGADTYLTHLAPLFGRVRYLPVTGVLYRLHGSNNFETSDALLSLNRVRRNAQHAARTHNHLNRVACAIGLQRAPRRIVSVSEVISRMSLCKLDPGPGDENLVHLMWLGASAVRRRFDVGLMMKVLYVFWFALMAVAPRPLARKLVVYMMFPQARRPLNGVLRWMQRG